MMGPRCAYSVLSDEPAGAGTWQSSMLSHRRILSGARYQERQIKTNRTLDGKQT